MINNFFAYPLIILLAFSISCKEKEETEPLRLVVAPDHLVFSSKMGQVVQFTIQGSSSTALRNLFITSKKGTSFSQTLLDSTFTGIQNFKHTYEYLVPDSSSAYSVILNFRILDMDGIEKSAARKIDVNL